MFIISLATQQCTREHGLKPDNEKKSKSAARCRNHAEKKKRSNRLKMKHYIIALGPNSPNYQEPNLSTIMIGKEERGNLACVRAAWIQLGEAISGPAPCSLTLLQSCIIHSLHSVHSSISVTAGPSCTLPHYDIQFRFDFFCRAAGRYKEGGRLTVSRHGEISGQNGCIAYWPLIGSVCCHECDCSVVWTRWNIVRMFCFKAGDAPIQLEYVPLIIVNQQNVYI